MGVLFFVAIKQLQTLNDLQSDHLKHPVHRTTGESEWTRAIWTAYVRQIMAV